MKITAHKPDQNQSYNNPFKDIYPFSQIGRVVTDKNTGAIIAELSEDNSFNAKNGEFFVFDDTKHDIMVKFPKFFYKREWNGNNLQESILTEVPYFAVGKDGYEIFPTFLREDGSIRDYVLYGAFKGAIVEEQLRSIKGYLPAHTKTIGQFRDLARQGRNATFNIETISIVSMVQLLYKVAFQDLNSQSALGKGWTEKSASATTGGTMELGNRSGYLGVNGNQISLFGIEDFYGSIWSFVDGLLITDTGYNVTNNVANFGDIAKHVLVPATPLMGETANAGSDGYFKTIEKISGAHKYMNIPNAVGSTSSTNYTDYFASHRKSQTNICRFGDYWDSRAGAGAFCFGLYAVASGADSKISARLVVLP
ncbi:MAG: hypothetical protein ACRC0G_06510 [Fusobacteriaceae bacterium]